MLQIWRSDTWRTIIGFLVGIPISVTVFIMGIFKAILLFLPMYGVLSILSFLRLGPPHSQNPLGLYLTVILFYPVSIAALFYGAGKTPVRHAIAWTVGIVVVVITLGILGVVTWHEE